MVPILPADASGITRAARAVRSGGVIVYPTETVYGLGGDPHDPHVVDRIHEVKGREAGKGIILLVPEIEDIHTLIEPPTEAAQLLMGAFWPGPLTLVFRARPGLSEKVMGAGRTVALRVSDAPIVRDLLRQVGGPLVSTSANRSGEPPALTAEEADRSLGNRVDLVLDGGPAGDRPSTVVDVVGDDARVLREGRIPSGSIRSALKCSE